MAKRIAIKHHKQQHHHHHHDESSESDVETEPAKIFHRRLSTNIKSSVSISNYLLLVDNHLSSSLMRSYGAILRCLIFFVPSFSNFSHNFLSTRPLVLCVP
jgi:hypothetical protein